jgi:hypothetical protein
LRHQSAPFYSGKFRRFRFEAHKLEMTGPTRQQLRLSGLGLGGIKAQGYGKHNNITLGCSALRHKLPSLLERRRASDVFFRLRPIARGTPPFLRGNPAEGSFEPGAGARGRGPLAAEAPEEEASDGARGARGQQRHLGEQNGTGYGIPRAAGSLRTTGSQELRDSPGQNRPSPLLGPVAKAGVWFN